MVRALWIILFILPLVFLLGSCNQKNSLLEKIAPDKSGIHFSNNILESDSLNVLDVENVYNGGGVAIADFNNDNLQDIYFTGNAVPNKMYLNKGDFVFEDITTTAGVDGQQHWSRGASAVDINNDGLMDLHISASLSSDPTKRENLLYVNKGKGADGVPRFENQAREYGLDDTSHTTMAAFFDYDNDGDLDVYLLVNQILKKEYPNQFRPILKNGEHPSTGKLFRNDWSDSLRHAVFKNVSREAGITIEGYGHGVTITDINLDGWKDIYVTNDFLSNNILYINNGNGTFTDKVTQYFKHTASNSMGQDIEDINNDGLQDIIELDMNPEDNYRKKMMMPSNKYQAYQNSDYYGYQYQYVRNTLQLNLGTHVKDNDSISDPVFADIGFLSGIAETDWSWTPMVVDFDNDGLRDIIITNGFPKDVTDQDFTVYRTKAISLASKSEVLSQIPTVKIPNYAFKNNGDLTFSNVSSSWGIDEPSFSSGAAYADLDNDGDLDCVINNIDQEAFVYRNTINAEKENNHYLRIKFSGTNKNINGLGAWVTVYSGDKQQVYENTPFRGYLSTIQAGAHFGMGKNTIVDSLIVRWPGDKTEIIRNIKTDQVLEVFEKNAHSAQPLSSVGLAVNNLFSDKTSALGINYIHEERDFIDFNIQKLLPHKFSEYGPALAAGDLNGDGLDDMIAGGSYGNIAQVFIQSEDGKFIQRNLIAIQKDTKQWDDMGLLLFDADADGDLDIYVASGGFEKIAGPTYQDKLYINNGKGVFQIDTLGVPANHSSKSCVRAADYDQDGDLDLFIAGRVEPWNYPKPVSSFIYRNDSKAGSIKFTDVSIDIATSLNNIGLVCDAVWTDYDNDGWIDLLLAGEWMPLTLLKNEKGVFKNVTAETGVANNLGWWNSIAPGDYDNDGDIDYIVGNLGLNSFYRSSQKYPVHIYAKDFDNNGSYDAVPSLYLPPVSGSIERNEYPAHTREDMVKQMIIFRSKFQNFNSYAKATFPQLFTPEELKGALILTANQFAHVYLRNNGKGKFSIAQLPVLTQITSINGMVSDDFDGDGNLDVAINTNDYSTEVIIGRYDGGNGTILRGDGKGNFSVMPALKSGIFIPGNGKSLIKLNTKQGNYLLAASQNRGAMKVFNLKRTTQTIPVLADDCSVEIKYANGKIQKRELAYGSSFLSQSSRNLTIDGDIVSITIFNYRGKSRVISIASK